MVALFGCSGGELQLNKALAFSVKYCGVWVQRSSFTPEFQCQIGTSSVLFLFH